MGDTEVAANVKVDADVDVDAKMQDAKMEDAKPQVDMDSSNVNAEPDEADKKKTTEDEDDVDAQLEAMKKRLADVEAQRLQLNGEGDKADINVSGGAIVSDGVSPSGVGVGGATSRSGDDAVAESDARSVYVGNVDYGATVEELGAHFTDCGTINRVTIMCNKATGMPKGFAYIEFADESSVKHAMILDGTEFRGRKIKVVAKRTNVPGMSYRGRRPRLRGRGFGRRGRRGFRGRWY